MTSRIVSSRWRITLPPTRPRNKKSGSARLAEIFPGCYEKLDKLCMEGKVRKNALEEVKKAILCGYHQLGTHFLECPCCHKVTEVYCTCHGRLCPSCGAKTQRIISASAAAACVDCTHRHIIFTIPEEYRKLFQFRRDLLNLLYIAARNTIFIIANRDKYMELLRKARKAGKSVYDINGGVYLFSGDKEALVPGMISCLHSFGRDLKWNPHIHSCVAEVLWNPCGETHKDFHFISFEMLRKHWQRQLNELLLHELGPVPVKVDGKLVARFGKGNPTYGKYPDGYYVYAAYTADMEPENFECKGKGNETKGNDSAAQCIKYIIRYSSRPAISEGR